MYSNFLEKQVYAVWINKKMLNSMSLQGKAKIKLYSETISEPWNWQKMIWKDRKTPGFVKAMEK